MKKWMMMGLYSVAACAMATNAHAQHATTPAPVSPTENLHRGTQTNPTNAFSIKRYGAHQVFSTGRKIMFGQEQQIRQGMRLANIETERYRVAQEVAECLFSAMGDKVTTLVPTQANDGAIVIVGSSCYKQARAEVDQDSVVGALSEELIRRKGKTYEPRALTVDVNAAEAFSGLVPGAAPDFAMIGRCVAVYSPGLVRDVLEAEPGTRKEKKALDRVYASTPECGLSKAPGAVPTTYQRSALAVGLYDWMHGG